MSILSSSSTMHAATIGSRSSRPLAGLGRFTALELHICWGSLLLVCGVCTALVTTIAFSIADLYPTPSERATYAATAGVSIPAIAFNGRGYGLTTLGGITAIEVGFMGQILFPLLGVLTAIRLTRREEEAGRTDLLTASRVGRLVPLTATVIALAITALATGMTMTVGMMAAGLPRQGSAWYAAGVGTCVFFYATIGLVLAQLCQDARTAQHLGMGVVSVTYLVRFVVDGMQWDAVWVSPLGWLPEVRAFDDPCEWPLVAYAMGSTILLGLSVFLATHRDAGAGLLVPRPGPSRGPRRATSSWRLALGMQRGATASWLLLAVVWALLIGLFSEEVTRNVEANPTMLEAMGLDRATDLMVQLASIIIVAATSAIAVQAAGRLGVEETSGRLGLLLSTRLARRRLWLGWWATTLISCLAALAFAVLVLGAAIRVVTGDEDSAFAAVQTGWGHAVPIALIVALAALLAALGPRWHVLGWMMVVWTAVVGFLAEALDLPEWARDLSPTHAVGVLPVDDPDPQVLVIQGISAIILVTASLIVFRHRDLRAG